MYPGPNYLVVLHECVLLEWVGDHEFRGLVVAVANLALLLLPARVFDLLRDVLSGPTVGCLCKDNNFYIDSTL